MKLSQMQDIGGCRAVMPSMAHARELIRTYERAKSKNPHHRPLQDDVDDYIVHPKSDGYRSYHLIFRYQSTAKEKQGFVGQRIEIQIRSQLQHAWATAVETVQTFTGQALKSRIKSGDPQWLRFFSLMGSALALRESRPLVPSTPENPSELIEEIRYLATQLSVEQVLRGFGSAAQYMMELPSDSEMFLLVLDPVKRTTSVTPFRKEAMTEATDMYLRIEKEAEQHPQLQAVLVSVDSVEALRTAYPNYYLDTTAFIDAMQMAIRKT